MRPLYFHDGTCTNALPLALPSYEWNASTVAAVTHAVTSLSACLTHGTAMAAQENYDRGTSRRLTISCPDCCCALQ
jgi:hypothetical protein